jgi:biopolymer transport protein ExbD
MAVKIRCPICNKSHSVNERVLGKQIQCPNCSRKIQLPSSDRLEAIRKERQESINFQAQLESSLKHLESSRQSNAGFSGLSERGHLPSEEGRSLEYNLNNALRLLSETGGSSNQWQEMDRQTDEERELLAASVDFTRPKETENQDMDMTPMVDVTFLLLIFFMVTASFVVQKSIQSPAEPSDEPSLTSVVEEDDSDTVYVQVDEFNAFNVVVGGVDTPVVSKQDLTSLLTKIHSGGNSTRAPTKLVIDAHENCIHAAVVIALDSGREAQFESFQVRTVEQFD